LLLLVAPLLLLVAVHFGNCRAEIVNAKQCWSNRQMLLEVDADTVCLFTTCCWACRCCCEVPTPLATPAILTMW
jgi:hypothetical protein